MVIEVNGSFSFTQWLEILARMQEISSIPQGFWPCISTSRGVFSSSNYVLFRGWASCVHLNLFSLPIEYCKYLLGQEGVVSARDWQGPGFHFPPGWKAALEDWRVCSLWGSSGCFSRDEKLNFHEQKMTWIWFLVSQVSECVGVWTHQYQHFFLWFVWCLVDLRASLSSAEV